mmetsp:Transcript_50144/g.116427  ORF Transcript_50144/g.116427 Transcript_50144/m.116427 type:complete len:239 (-) Transcript_50144:37-753(-)
MLVRTRTGRRSCARTLSSCSSRLRPRGAAEALRGASASLRPTPRSLLQHHVRTLLRCTGETSSRPRPRKSTRRSWPRWSHQARRRGSMKCGADPRVTCERRWRSRSSRTRLGRKPSCSSSGAQRRACWQLSHLRPVRARGLSRQPRRSSASSLARRGVRRRRCATFEKQSRPSSSAGTCPWGRFGMPLGTRDCRGSRGVPGARGLPLLCLPAAGLCLRARPLPNGPKMRHRCLHAVNR